MGEKRRSHLEAAFWKSSRPQGGGLYLLDRERCPKNNWGVFSRKKKGRAVPGGWVEQQKNPSQRKWERAAFGICGKKISIGKGLEVGTSRQDKALQSTEKSGS